MPEEPNPYSADRRPGKRASPEGAADAKRLPAKQRRRSEPEWDGLVIKFTSRSGGHECAVRITKEFPPGIVLADFIAMVCRQVISYFLVFVPTM
eukprot:SAG31_NODE_3133_length_4638_cov_6.219432_5_plen_94_part_00